MHAIYVTAYHYLLFNHINQLVQITMYISIRKGGKIYMYLYICMKDVYLPRKLKDKTE